MATDDGSNRDTIVLGGSAGGIDALRQTLCAFGPGLEASIFIVLHLPADAPSVLDEVLGRLTPLKTVFAKDGEPILAGQIYVAPPDRHLLLHEDHLKLSHGARENHSRPAIDPLFRSAAVARRGRVIGAVLSGLLNDGAAGLHSIKRCGGLTFAQSTDDAEWADMPRNATRALGSALDGALPAAELGRHIAMLVSSPAPNAVVPRDVELEVEMLLRAASGMGTLLEDGLPPAVTCPECGESLRGIGERGNVLLYRCHAGHAFDLSSPLATQVAQNEQAMWATMKALEERSRTFLNMARDESKLGRELSAAYFREEATRLLGHAETLRSVLMTRVLS